MSDKDILTHFEVTLSDEVLHNVATTGKVFKSQLCSAENEATSGLQSCILLDKINDNLVKLLVTVYNSPDVWVRRAETTDNDAQTDVNSTSEVDIQAEVCTQDQPVQATVDMCAGDCQAAVTNVTVDCQTEVNDATCATQTAMSMALQADFGVQAATETAIVHSQTTVSMALESEQGVQVAAELAAVDSQTSVSMAWQHDQMSQASAQCLEQPSQTTVSMALQAEQSVQAVSATAADGSQTTMSMALQSEQEVQAVMMTTACDSQTAMSMALQGEQGVQAVSETATGGNQTAMSIALQADQSMQAIVDTSVGDSQTVVSMALQCEQEMQTVVATVAGDCQTDMSMALMSEQAVQAVAETAAKDGQTVNDADTSSQVDVSSSQLSTVTDSQSDAVTNSQTDVAVTNSQTDAVTDSQPDAANDSQQKPDIPTDFGFAPPLDGPHERHDQCDGEAQTDPVTIIIGDASFLVEQLKGSASSPGKVNTSGNQIEIEVRNDITVDHTVPTGRDEIRAPHNKENDASRAIRRITDQEAELFNLQARVEQSDGPDSGKYSCPFCTMTFHESPGLYDHLQNSHNEKCKSVKKARGREGKTIIYREPTAPSGMPLSELEPPVLVPIMPWQGQSDSGEGNKNTDEDTTPAAAATAPTAAEEQNEGSVEEGQQYCCPLCPKTFATTSGLEVHWAAVHKAALAGGKAVRQMRPRTAETTEDPAANDAAPKRRRSSTGIPSKRIKQEDELSPSRVTRSSDRSGMTTRVSRTPPKLERQQRHITRKK